MIKGNHMRISENYVDKIYMTDQQIKDHVDRRYVIEKLTVT